jgi:hypothetical protein
MSVVKNSFAVGQAIIKQAYNHSGSKLLSYILLLARDKELK